MSRNTRKRANVDISEDSENLPVDNTNKKAKKVKTENVAAYTDYNKIDGIENLTPPPSRNDSKEEKVEELQEVEHAPAEDKPLTKAGLKTAKIAKLKQLLSCIQKYAQFTSSQLAGRQEFDIATAKKTSKNKSVEMFTGQLRDYQVEGVRWLKMLHDLAINGILADEMGLGKTVMVIAMLAKVIATGAQGPFLVIAPLSTLPNWYNEVRRFAPEIPVVLFHGNSKKRKSLRSEIEAVHNLPKKYHPNAKKVCPVVITSYEMVISETSYLSKVDWRILVVDEAQRLKNEKCILRNKLRKFRTPRRLILTGTPIQNTLTELWSLMAFLMPDIFNTRLSSFESLLDEILSNDSSLWVTDENDAQQKEEIIALLHEILKPFILRRMKSDIDLTIPPKKELVVKCSLTKLQAELYGKLIDTAIEKAQLSKKGELDEDAYAQGDKRERQQTVFFGVNDEEDTEEIGESYIPVTVVKTLNENGEIDEEIEEDESDLEETEEEMSVNYWLESWGKMSLRNLIMQLRKSVNHPYLFRMSYVINENFINNSCKLRLLDVMLEKLFEDKVTDHKAIIYSQFVKNLDILAQYCEYRKLKYVRIDGNTSLEQRGENILEFNNNPEISIFLVSTRAGGLGINLTAADTVFIYDSDWNPQMDLQARDRCHRIGQTKPVVVYRFIVSNTIDQRMWECATGKRRLERVVLHQPVFTNAASSLLHAADSKAVSTVENDNSDGSEKPYKFSFTVDDMLTLLELRDWEEKDESAFNFDGPKEEIDRRLAELLDRSDLVEQWEAVKKGKYL